ncbi:glycosyltransferase family 4 protein [Aetokthonos hydrillicola Thurmond2011]|uniref:Glycosyltransferase family 4 protein n=1 Tax=Aetokthonos hydrillicola Thurmond2011 TaxID=2712845 RepID=A0AAP5I967_9CYAN|nr:glycosyltransferase family 4 protein [Aetokthonos hydrillicola]MBO3457553.1 glycosyltransferase family 4 protein [Aetokthonos hydrillicola CCALA 1050]MBW4590763.1 glycosyltransferase family 4 protein [Aetokthonos hydrillicola CCALA 1050]MDR9894765.1 glycosyltransferase family 4 protein [Aetokthonos hydrillicola Thurmond2011]
MYNFGFIVEQMLGHITHYQNLIRWVGEDDEVSATWRPIKSGVNDIWENLPIVRSNWSLQASLRAREAIQNALRSNPLDVLFLHSQTLALFAIPVMQQIPTIISTDATPLNLDSIAAGYNHKVDGNPLFERSKFLWNRSTYHAATTVVAYCQWVKDSLITDYGVPEEKVIVIPPGVDMEQWDFGRDRALRPKTQSDRLRLLFVGGEFARKGGCTLLEAFRQTLHQYCSLDIVTKDTNLEQELAGMEGVRLHYGLTANSPELKDLFAKADIFVFPTLADCFPNVVIEAMAAGLPIITTNVGGLSEQVEDGENALIIPPSDANALIAAVSALKNDETKRVAMAVKSRRLAEQRFDARRNYGAILSLMKSMSKEVKSKNREQRSYARI